MKRRDKPEMPELFPPQCESIACCPGETMLVMWLLLVVVSSDNSTLSFVTQTDFVLSVF